MMMRFQTDAPLHVSTMNVNFVGAGFCLSANDTLCGGKSL